jgi:hypothetical protein
LDIEALMRARAELADLVVRLLGKRPKTVQKKLARFLQKEAAYRLASQVITVPDASASDFLRADLQFVEPSWPRVSSLPAQHPSVAANREPRDGEVAGVRSKGNLGSVSSGEPLDTDDLQEFKKRKAWSVSDGRHN